jgi:hypothetical protein
VAQGALADTETLTAASLRKNPVTQAAEELHYFEKIVMRCKIDRSAI